MLPCTQFPRQRYAEWSPILLPRGGRCRRVCHQGATETGRGEEVADDLEFLAELLIRKIDERRSVGPVDRLIDGEAFAVAKHEVPSGDFREKSVAKRLFDVVLRDVEAGWFGLNNPTVEAPYLRWKLRWQCTQITFRPEREESIECTVTVILRRHRCSPISPRLLQKLQISSQPEIAEAAARRALRPSYNLMAALTSWLLGRSGTAATNRRPELRPRQYWYCCGQIYWP